MSAHNASTRRGTAATSVAAQVRMRRRQRGLSAAELARIAGLSKATLSAVEAGTGNPTVETLDALAVALRIPLTDLLASDEPTEPVIRHREVSDPGLPAQELLHRIGAGRAVEIWSLRLPPNSAIEGVPHSAGTMEHVLVNSGALHAGPTDDPRALNAGDLFVFLADGPHRYFTDDEVVDATVIMAAPQSL